MTAKPAAITFAVASEAGGYAVQANGKTLSTPDKRPFIVPTQEMAQAIAGEFSAHGKFAAGKMPLATLAQTAIDRIEDQKELIVESLLTYVDTDALVYRSSSSQKLLDRQKREWDPILAWLKTRLDATWETTTGVMPVDQPAALHSAVRLYLNQLDAMRLAGLCMLSATYSSVALAIAVCEGRLNAKDSFALSRLEEETQAETWGRDAEAEKRAAKMQEEIMATGQFLDLLAPL
jgi:chaperone required for assembly of F1-ATPase